MMRRILFVMTLMMIFATVAEAQRPRPRSLVWQREGRWDLTLSTRYTTAKEYTGEGGSGAKLQDDLGWGFGFGYNFNQHFNLGVYFSWRSIPYEATVINAEDQSVEKFSSQLSTSNFGLNLDYNVLKGRITPYVNGSMAWMHVDSNIFAGWTSGCWWYPYWGYRCGPVPLTYGANTSAYSLGLGGRFEMTEGFFFKVGYERAWFGLDTADNADMFRIDIGLML